MIVKSQVEFFHCGEQIRKVFAEEITDVASVVEATPWVEQFTHSKSKKGHQEAYNFAFADRFVERGWESQPKLRTKPELIGDFRKGLVFVEVQFGNSAALYRDYYKFQYGLAHGLLSMAVLIVPADPSEFFPSRSSSIRNMAEFTLARSCFTILSLNVPTMLVGLLRD